MDELRAEGERIRLGQIGFIDDYSASRWARRLMARAVALGDEQLARQLGERPRP